MQAWDGADLSQSHKKPGELYQSVAKHAGQQLLRPEEQRYGHVLRIGGEVLRDNHAPADLEHQRGGERVQVARRPAKGLPDSGHPDHRDSFHFRKTELPAEGKALTQMLDD